MVNRWESALYAGFSLYIALLITREPVHAMIHLRKPLECEWTFLQYTGADLWGFFSFYIRVGKLLPERRCIGGIGIFVARVQYKIYICNCN